MAIIQEEIARELSGQVLTEEQLNEGIKDWFKRNKFPAALLGLGMAILGPVYKVSNDAQEKQRAENITLAFENMLESSKKVETQKDFRAYLNNNSAFRWGKGGEKMMIDRSAYTVNKNGEKVTQPVAVMPLSFTIAVIAYMDKENGNPPRFGVPNKVIKLSSTPTASPEQATSNKEQFFNQFNLDYVDVFDTVGGLIDRLPTDVDAEGRKYPVVMVDPGFVMNTLSSDYVLPENQKTFEEYYNWVYFSQYLSIEDVQVISAGIDSDSPEQMRHIEDLFRKAKPELAKLERQVGALTQD